MDQLMLWPDPTQRALHGELTLDPELTRDKRAAPSPEAARRVLELVKANLVLTLDGRALRFEPQARELWSAGGATLGDLVVFSAPLPESAHELRVATGPGLGELIVSVQVAAARGPASTTSWLLAANDSTPTYLLGAGWQAPGFRVGGPEAFAATAAGAPEQPPAPVARVATPEPVASAAALVARFVRLGVTHILPGGIDHVLFVAGLMLGCAGRYRRAIAALSLFTLAHTLALALAQFGVVAPSSRWVEPLIALSILVVGLDNLRPHRGERDAPVLGRALVVLGFGLIHGLGFAGALTEQHFDPDRLGLALLGFNVGVELGQLAIALAVGVVLAASRDHARRAVSLGSALVAASGMFLMIDRLELGPPPARAVAAPTESMP